MKSMAAAKINITSSINVYISDQSIPTYILKSTMPVTRSQTRQEQNRIQNLCKTRPILNRKNLHTPFERAEAFRRTTCASEVFRGDPASRTFFTSVIDSKEEVWSRDIFYRRLSSGALLMFLSLVPVLQPEYVEAAGLALAPEPSNALSLPTWIIHVASVVEWIVAMSLVWRYGGLEGREAWRGLAWGMLPLLVGAMCACTWHFFYNSPELEALVALQGAMTFIGNCTCWAAAYRIYKKSEASQ